MFVVPGVVLLGLAAVSSGVVFFGARAFAARALVSGGVLTGLGLDHAHWVKAPLSKRIAFVLSGPFACYLLASAFFAASFLIDGRFVADPHEMHVLVVPDGPAATAGIRGGDEIVSIDGAPISSWPELTTELTKRTGAQRRVGVRHRDGNVQTFDVTPDANEKLGVFPNEKKEPVGFLSAIGLGLVATPRMWLNVGRGVITIFSGSHESRNLMPAVFGRLAWRISVGGVIERVGTLVGYYFVVLAKLFALVFWPGARWFASARKAAEK